MIKDRGGLRLLTASAPSDDEAVVHIFLPATSTSLFRWLPRVVEATSFVRRDIDKLCMNGEEGNISTITVVTHFDEISRGTGIPSTSSRDLMPSIRRNTHDLSNESPPTPTFLKHILHVKVEPNRLSAVNPFPLETIAGLGRSLSARNAVQQEEFLVTGESLPGASLSVDGYRKWILREQLVNLVSRQNRTRRGRRSLQTSGYQINHLSQSPYPTLNVHLKIVLRRDFRDARPTPTEVESLVRGFLPAYSSFLQHLLKRTGKEQTATRSSLGGQPCNPQLAIVVTHPSGDVQNVQICPTPYGQSVIVSYAEGGKWRLHEHWKAVKRSDTVVCEQLELVEE